MGLPFTAEQFFAVFVTYNAAIWPMQIVAYILGFLAVSALRWRSVFGMRLILVTLAIMWAWNGIAYHLAFFAQINPLAYGFTAIFLLQSILFAASSAPKSGILFQIRADPRSALGLSLIVYALLVYEILGDLAGHGLMAGPLFGVAPCPTAIFTIGMLLLARGRPVAWLAIIPVVWSLIGLSAAFQLGVQEDFALAVAALALLIALATARSRGNKSGERWRG